MAIEPGDRDSDVDRLFSWLQTPDLHYREFADGREVPDAVVTRVDRPVAPPAAETATVSATAELTRPGQAAAPPARTTPAPSARQEPAMIAPTPIATPHAVPATSPAPAAPPSAEPTVAARLFGGTARDSAAADREAAASKNTEPQQPRSLDAVFGRLAGGNTRPADPRERLRHIPGLNPPPERSR